MNNIFADASALSSQPVRVARVRSHAPGARGAAAVPLRGPAPLTLDRMAIHRAAVVERVDAAAAGQPPERARQLADIGFTPGERVVIVGRAWPGAGALVVLVGQSRFALRSAEAACVRVRAID